MFFNRRRRSKKRRNEEPEEAVETIPNPEADLASLSAKLNEPVGRTRFLEHDVPRFDSRRQTESRLPHSLNPIGRLAEAVGRDRQQEQEVRLAEMQQVLAQIAVVAFVGPSGTGKSTRAIRVARANGIKYLIDDGLLIHGGRIIAGTSAKRAPTRIESVRQAVFWDQTRAANMRRALAEQKPTTLMILGTSDSMLSKICNNLWLNQPAMLIRIEDVTTEEERQIAKQTRLTAGQHTIPVPSMEIKHEFSGYFSDPMGRLRRRFDRERGVKHAVTDTDRTVVRPTFSTLGNYSMSDEAIRHMINLIAVRVKGVNRLLKCKLQMETTSLILHLDLELYYGYNAQEVLNRAQGEISRQIEEYTAISVLSVNVTARRVVMQALSVGVASAATGGGNSAPSAKML